MRLEKHCEQREEISYKSIWSFIKHLFAILSFLKARSWLVSCKLEDRKKRSRWCRGKEKTGRSRQIENAGWVSLSRSWKREMDGTGERVGERALTGKGGENEKERARARERARERWRRGGKKVSRLCGDWRSLVPWTGGARLANVQPSPRSTQAVSNHARAATGRTRRRLCLLLLNNNNRWVKKTDLPEVNYSTCLCLNTCLFAFPLVHQTKHKKTLF